MREAALAPPAPARALRLIVGLRIRAFVNQLGGLIVTGRGGRSRAAPRRGVLRDRGSAVTVVLGLLFLGLGFMFALGVTGALRDWALDTGAAARTFPSRAPESRAYVEGLAFFVNWALLAVLCIGLGLRDPRHLGARIEGVLALPVSLPLAFVAEIAERALVNPFLWLSVFPLLTVALHVWGFSDWAAPALAAPLTLAHGLTVGAWEFALALLARQRLAPARAQTFRALVLGVGMLSLMAFQPFLIDMTRPFGKGEGVARPALRALAGPSLFAPGGAALPLLRSGTHGGLGPATWIPLVLIVASWAGALVLLARVSSRGLDAVMPVGGERGAAARPSPLVRLFSGAAAEEVLGLVRDKPAFTLNVLVPAMALVFHMWLMPEEVATPRSLAGVAVLLGAMIAGSAALSLPRMGESVWLLFSVARPVERLVLERAAVWCGFGMLAALGALGLLAARGGAVLPEQRGAAAVILLGIPALTLGSAALGILGTDASAGDSHRRLRPEESVNQLVLVMVLGAAAFIPATGTRVKLLLLFMAIGAALWQRAKRHLPFVLDPAARGVRPIDAADGLKAMLAFFALQVLLFMGFREAVWGGKPLHPAWVVNLSLLFAGLMAIAVTVDPLVKQGLPLRGVLPLWAGRASPARLLAGAGVGIVALVLALGYLALLQERLGGPLPESWRPRVLLEALRHPIARVAATVVLAPVIEEIIFRGLLFRGIQQALGTRAAVLLSALGFALVHPEPSFGAVFGLGALAAWIYDRTGLLSASMLAHAVYNGLLILGAG